MHKLHDLKQALIEELESRAERGVNNMTEAKEIDVLAHAAKNLGKLIEMCEDEEESSSYRGGSYRSPGYRVYARRRDSMGRYARAGQDGDEGMAHESGYAEAQDDMLGRLGMKLNEARSEEERRVIRKLMDEMRR